MLIQHIVRQVRGAALAGSLAACFFALGCASSQPPVVIRAAEIGKVPSLVGKRPLVIAFKAGERLPVLLDVSGDIIEVEPRPSRIWLVAKRDFFLRIDGARLTTSLDGVHFDRHPAKPGSFRFGFGADATNGPHIEAAIVTPEHAR
jgi:hypothetical protein